MKKRDHSSKGIYRTREETAALKAAVLDMWAAGHEGDDIGERLGIKRAYVDKIVRRARGQDERAARRRQPNKPNPTPVATPISRSERPETKRRLTRIVKLRAKGKTAEEIAEILGLKLARVYASAWRGGFRINPSKPEVAARNDRVLELWLNGERPKTIAAETGLPAKAVCNVVWQARQNGDPRAVRRAA